MHPHNEAKFAWAVHKTTWYHYADRQFFTQAEKQKCKCPTWFLLLLSGINLEQHYRECLPPPKHLTWLTLKPAMYLRCGTEWLSFQLPSSDNSPKTKANTWLIQVHIWHCRRRSSVFLLLCSWNIEEKIIYCFIKCLHPHFHANAFSPNASLLLPAAAACVISNMCKSLSGWQNVKEQSMLI